VGKGGGGIGNKEGGKRRRGGGVVGVMKGDLVRGQLITISLVGHSPLLVFSRGGRWR